MLRIATQYVKQYGTKRSGTNYAKAFIEANYPDVCVVANVLGWKHGPFKIDTDYAGLSWLGDWGRPNADLISAKSKPIVEAIVNQYETDRLLYLLVIRNPYRWIEAYFRYRGFRPRLSLSVAKQYARHWSTANRRWVDALPADRTYVLSYDHLIDNPRRIGNELTAFLRVMPVQGGPIMPPGVVSPGLDYGKPWRKKRRSRLFTTVTLRAMKPFLDKGLMKMFGYR